MGFSPGRNADGPGLPDTTAECTLSDLTMGGAREKLLPEEAAGGHPEDIGILFDADSLLGSEP